MKFYLPKKQRKLSEWHDYYAILPKRIGDHVYCFHWIYRKGTRDEGGPGFYDYPHWTWEYGI